MTINRFDRDRMRTYVKLTTSPMVKGQTIKVIDGDKSYNAKLTGAVGRGAEYCECEVNGKKILCHFSNISGKWEVNSKIK